ncbi:MAG: helix-turn-helix transcriptional regulator [Clostridia bacterium]|nr:helix-turn-helix transcriptional regulator [Clostridia bacterium]
MIHIGERIRDLRQKRGMTQKALAGTHMTRNMLSLIENGQAAPSLSTVLYLAEQLDAPAGYFFAVTEEDERQFYKMMVIPEIKQLYRNGCFAECEQRIQEMPSGCMDDEIAFIAAQCYFGTAMQYASEYALKSADSHFSKAEEATQNTIYAGEDFKSAVSYYQGLISLLLSASDLTDEITGIGNASALVPADMLQYFAELQVYAGNQHSLSVREWDSGSYYSRHIHGLYLISSAQYKQAVEILRDLLEDGGLPFYMRYRICSDLENAANADGDFRAAYNAARRKLELMECAKK